MLAVFVFSPDLLLSLDVVVAAAAAAVMFVIVVVVGGGVVPVAVVFS